MKTFSLCCFGFLVGTAAAFVSQTPVLETLGYAPEAKTTATAPNLDVADEPNTSSRVATSSDSNETKESADAAAQAIRAKNLATYSESVDELPMTDESGALDHQRLFSEGIFTSQTGLPYQLPYRLFKPAKIVPGKRYPLTVFLHGADERGSNNKSQLANGSKEFVQWMAKTKIDSYVLFPQCPLGEQWVSHQWYETEHSANSTPTQSMSAVLSLIDELRRNESIDDDHIFATGLSMGGFGVYDLIARRPGFFAAGAVFCGGSDCSPPFIKKLAPTRMYIVHGQADEIVSVENSRNVVAALKQAGAKPKYVEVAGAGHNCWTAAFSDSEVFSWLYSGVKPTDAKTTDAQIASRLPPKKITNKFLRPSEKVTAARTATDFADASSKAPSIRPKKGSLVKKQVVVAKPPIGEVKPEAPIKKTPLAKTKRPVKVPKTVAKATETPKAKTETGKSEALSGQWQVTKAVHAGRVLSEKQTKAMAMEFVGEDIIIKLGKKLETGKFEVSELEFANDSASAELEIKSNRENTPSIKGFYTKNGEVLTMVWGAPGAKRPDPNVAKELDAARTLTLIPSVNK